MTRDQAMAEIYNLQSHVDRLRRRLPSDCCEEIMAWLDEIEERINYEVDKLMVGI